MVKMPLKHKYAIAYFGTQRVKEIRVSRKIYLSYKFQQDIFFQTPDIRSYRNLLTKASKNMQIDDFSF